MKILINGATLLVVNKIAFQEGAPLEAPPGHFFVDAIPGNEPDIGWTYDDGVFVDHRDPDAGLSDIERKLKNTPAQVTLPDLVEWARRQVR